jgi:hypothetical protein
MVEVEVWVMVTEDGDYVCHIDRDELIAKHEEDVGSLSGKATRILKIAVSVPTPAPVELTATVAEEPASGELKVA